MDESDTGSGIVLHMAPFTCARVTAIALEQAGQPFATRPVRFVRGEHRSPDYRRINPLGKVPALAIDGTILTETVAILPAPTAADRAHRLADLCFCSATLHPIVTRIRLPGFFAGADNALAVKQAAERAMDDYFQVVEDRLATGAWWYGADWSAMDAYLYWVFWRVEGAGYDVARFPHFLAHARAMEARPAVRRALAREDAMQEALEREGSAFVPGRIG
jgi:glutathione S-transferase